MSKEKELKQTLHKLINQTEQALKEGWIYTNDFRKHLNEARQIIAEDNTTEDDTYPEKLNGFHIIQN